MGKLILYHMADSTTNTYHCNLYCCQIERVNVHTNVILNNKMRLTNLPCVCPRVYYYNPCKSRRYLSHGIIMVIKIKD